MKIDEQWECKKPYLCATKNKSTFRGGGMDDTCDLDLSRRALRVKPRTSLLVGWKVKVVSDD